MSTSKTRAEIERLVEELDDSPITAEEGQEAMRRLGLDVKSWAAAIRTRAGAAAASERKERYEEANRKRALDLERLESRRDEPIRPIEQQRLRMKALLRKAPGNVAVSAHFHKFEEATAEELAEMIKVLRHMLGEEDEET